MTVRRKTKPVKRKRAARKRAARKKPPSRRRTPKRRPKPPFEVIANADADRAHWLAQRQTVITASEVPIILGYARGAKKKPRLWYEKAGLLEPESLADVEHVQLGHAFEPLNATLFTEKTRRTVQRSQDLLRSTEYPWLGCTLDAWQSLVDGSIAPPFEYSDETAPLELKSTANGENWDDLCDTPHRSYQAQLQAQLLVTGKHWGSLACVLGSPVFRHRTGDYLRHADFSRLVLRETHKFWESLQRGEPPVDDSEDTEAALRALEALADETVTLPEVAAEWDHHLQEAQDALRIWERRKRYYSNLLRTKLGNATKGLLPHGDGAYQCKPEPVQGYVVQPHVRRVLRRLKR